MTDLKWTKEPPTKEDVYWMRWRSHGITFPAVPVMISSEGRIHLISHTPLDTTSADEAAAGAEFFGPLEPPV